MADKLTWESLYKTLTNLSPREKLILDVTVLFVGVMIVDRLVLSPIAAQIHALNQQTKQEETTIKKNLRILAQKDKILAESRKFESYLTAAASDEEEMTLLLKEVEDLASKNSVYLIDLKPGEVKGTGSSKKYSVNLSLEAQMEQLVAFMYGVESSDRLFTIEKYQLEPKSRESTVARCSMIISKVAAP